jgi:hypothetical protein
MYIKITDDGCFIQSKHVAFYITTDCLIVYVILDRFAYHQVVSLYLCHKIEAGLLILFQDILRYRLVPQTCYSHVIRGYRLRLCTNPGYSTTVSVHTLS